MCECLCGAETVHGLRQQVASLTAALAGQASPRTLPPDTHDNVDLDTIIDEALSPSRVRPTGGTLGNFDCVLDIVDSSRREPHLPRVLLISTHIVQASAYNPLHVHPKRIGPVRPG